MLLIEYKKGRGEGLLPTIPTPLRLVEVIKHDICHDPYASVLEERKGELVDTYA